MAFLLHTRFQKQYIKNWINCTISYQLQLHLTFFNLQILSNLKFNYKLQLHFKEFCHHLFSNKYINQQYKSMLE